MERIKRQQIDTIQNHITNKKRKLQNEIITNKSIFEDLANETVYEIFDYLDIYHVYKGFIKLNKRFKNLIIHSNLPITINISTMTKLDFARYYIGVILPNRRRINIFRLSNPFTVDIVFSPPRIITQFNQLETLILDNIIEKSFRNISFYLSFLPKLHSLSLNFAEYIQCPSIVFGEIFSLPKLKYCKITYREKDQYKQFPIHFSECDRSPIEYLLINTRFPLEDFGDLLCCLPKLRHLSIDCLVHLNYTDMDMEKNLGSIESKRLKYISLNFDWINFNKLEDLIKKHFRRVEVLRLTSKSASAYSNTKDWEQLISTYMPNLRIFDIYNQGGSLKNNPVPYHDSINQFNSSFWIEKQWFFTRQHDWQESIDYGTIYSTNPYRRKDFEFYWQMDEQICPYIQRTNLNSVKHVYFCSKRATNNYVYYFPNATELTIEHHFETTDVSISKILNSIIPLEKLIKLDVEVRNFPFEKIVELIRFTPNLCTLKFSSVSYYKINSNLIKQSQIFQYVSNTNKIKNLNLQGDFTLERTQLIVDLFPRLEYLKIRMNKDEINQVVRFLLSKNNTKTSHLFFLCILEIPKRCLKELDFLIKKENLRHDYFIKFVNRDLYLWW